MSARLRVRSRLSKQLWLTRVCGLVASLLGPVRRAVTTLLCGRHARALLFSVWAGTCSSTSVFLPFSVFVFVHTGWLFFSIGDSTASRDGQRTRGSVSCGHDVSGADHWLHRNGHVSDRHFFLCNPLQHQHSWTHEGDEVHCICWQHRTHIAVGGSGARFLLAERWPVRRPSSTVARNC